MSDSNEAQVPDDGFRFDARSVVSEEIRTDERYEGVRVRFQGHLAIARVQLQVDIGFGDQVVPAPVRVEYPAMLEFPGPRLLSYTPETTIAEKYRQGDQNYVLPPGPGDLDGCSHGVDCRIR